MLGFWILLILLIFLAASIPAYPYSRDWGYAPSGLIVVLIILWLLVLYLGWVAIWLPWQPAPPVAS